MRSMTALALALLGVLHAEAADGPTIDQVRLGKLVVGKDVSASDFPNKVVLVEEWGIHCGPCIASMPHLNAWNEEFSEFGFVVVGLHRQDATPKELKDACAAMGINFSIFDTGDIGDIGGSTKSGGIPHCALFSHTGDCVFDGSPRSVEPYVRKAVGAMLVADIRSPTKEMQPVIDAMKKGGSLADALKKLNTLKASPKPTSEQAKALSEKIMEGGKKRLETIKATMKEEPMAAYESAISLATRWKGYETGTKANELSMKLKSDPKVVAELKTRPSLEGIKKMDMVLSSQVKDEEFGTPEFKKVFAPQIKEMKKAYDVMKRQYPDARATKEAAIIIDKYDLPVATVK